jgi:hypothetical protein
MNKTLLALFAGAALAAATPATDDYKEKSKVKVEDNGDVKIKSKDNVGDKSKTKIKHHGDKTKVKSTENGVTTKEKTKIDRDGSTEVKRKEKIE